METFSGQTAAIIAFKSSQQKASSSQQVVPKAVDVCSLTILVALHSTLATTKSVAVLGVSFGS